MNSTETSTESIMNDQTMTAIKAGLYSFIFILGVFGNILVVKATKQYLTLQGATNILICNLCVCDIFMLVLGIPVFVIGEHRLIDSFGTSTCKVINPFVIAGLTITVSSLVAIAVERCNVIVNSRRFKLLLTAEKTYFIIAVIDILAIVSAAPLSVIEYKQDNSHCVRAWDRPKNIAYASLVFLFQYAIPLLVMVILYSICWYRIRKKNKTTIKLAKNNRKQSTNLIKERSHSDGDLVSLTDDNPIRIRPVSSEFLSNEIHDFLSGSSNHLSGIVKRQSFHRTSMRRSFSLDSICDPETAEAAKKRHSTCRKSITLDAKLSSYGSEDCEKEDTNALRPQETNLSKRKSFVGSMQRLHSSFQNLVTGTDGKDALTVFALKRVKQTLKTLRMFSFLVTAFAVCLLPHHIVSFMFEDVSETIRFFEILIYINAAVNPWIYAGMNKSYRVAFESFFRRKEHPLKRRRRLNNRRRKISLGSMKAQTDSSKLCWNKFIDCLCYKVSRNRGKYEIGHDPDEEATEALRAEERSERRDTFNGELSSRTSSTGKRLGSTSTRKDSTMSVRKDSRTSRKGTMTSEDGHIPILAPIIIITNYDEEMELQQAIEKAKNINTVAEAATLEGGEGDGEENRFSAIYSFFDGAW
eukprot:TCONS_00019197-protein